MADIVDMSYFLDGDGEIISEPPEARKLAQYLASIILMATYPGSSCPQEYRVACFGRPNKKGCREEIAGFIDPDTDNIVWMCPRCGDGGFIRNWQNTMWDLSQLADIDH